MAQVELLFKNGKIVTAGKIIDGFVAVDKERIVAVGEGDTAGVRAPLGRPPGGGRGRGAPGGGAAEVPGGNPSRASRGLPGFPAAGGRGGKICHAQ